MSPRLKMTGPRWQMSWRADGSAEASAASAAAWAAASVGVALEHPAVGHDVAARPEFALRIDDGSIRDQLDGAGGPEHGSDLAGLVHTRAEQRALRVGAADEDRCALGDARRRGGRGVDAPGTRPRRAEGREYPGWDVERVENLGRPLATADVVEHRLPGVRVLGQALATEQIGDPVVQHEERGDLRGVVVLAEPEIARHGENVGRRVTRHRV